MIKQILIPTVPLGEIILRGSLVYLALFFLMRAILRREAGTIGMADLLLVVLIGDAAQNGMASDHKSVGDAILLVLVLITWNYTFDLLAYHYPAIERLIQPPALPLIREGRLLPRNMRRELVTLDELMSHLREQGVEDVAEVKKAFIESDGRISVLRKEKSGQEPTQPPAGDTVRR